MLHSLMMAAVVALVTPAETPADSEFLENCRIVETRPDEGELDLVDPESEARTLREGDIVSEAGEARIKEIGESTVVLTRNVKGADGLSGEALIIVRFDPSGKTKVREYRTVPDGP